MSNPRERQQNLERLTEAWDEAGLDAAPLEPIATAFGRIATISWEAAAVREVNPLQAIGARVARGELTFQEGCEAHLLATAGIGHATGSSSQKRGFLIRTVAVAAALELAVDGLRGRGDELAGIVGAALADVNVELEKVNRTLAGVGSAEEAMAAGTKIVAAWQRRRELQGQRAAFLQVEQALSRLGIERVKAPSPEAVAV